MINQLIRETELLPIKDLKFFKINYFRIKQSLRLEMRDVLELESWRGGVRK